jgi:Kef-type K+ transport system membrane component KefB
MASDGPFTRTVLGVVVMSDLLVIVLFAIVSSVAKSFLGSQTDALHTASMLAWEVLGSLGIGAIAGVILSTYLRYVKGSSWLFVLASAFLIAEVGQRIDLDPLLIALASGMLIRNATVHGKRLQDEIEASSLPVYVVFFAVTGANVHIRELFVVGLPVVILILTRAAGFIGLGWLSTRLAGAPAMIQRNIGFGLMPQAGLALALALLFVRTFPSIGAEASALVFGGVALNELIAPVLYRYALVRSGEAGQANQTAPSDVPVVEHA